MPISVTGFVHHFSFGFDPEEATAGMAPDEAQELRAIWARSGDLASKRGTLLHYHAEMHLNAISLELPHSPEFKQLLQIHSWMLS